MVFESMIDRNTCHANVHAGLQRIPLGIEPQNSRMLCDIVVEKNYINVVVKARLLPTRSFLPFHFKGTKARL